MDQEKIKTDLISLFNDCARYTKKFHKRTYDTIMLNLWNSHAFIFPRLKNALEESEEALEQIASIIPDYAKGLVEALPSKRKRELACLDCNMNMVSYFLPLIGEMTSSKTKALTERMVTLWNQKLPGNKIALSTKEQVQGGFKQGLCYITTAVVKSLHKPDDCYELTLLRDYRDRYLMESEEGMDTVREYYNIAPTIVKRIGRQEDAAAVYEDIWRNYLSPCVSLIEKDQLEECRILYSEMVHRLEREFLYS